MKKIYIVSGEASGDLHAANLVLELKKISPELSFRAWGGQRLKREEVVIDKNISELAFMGFLEVVMNLPTILKNLQLCKKNILNFKPDLLILVDYPGFNLRIAKWAKSQKIPVFYYVSPQIWAWKESRIHQIKKTVSRMYCILPFEKDFYKKYAMSVEYLGHPLLDEIKKFKSLDNKQLAFDNNKPIIALLPGSRKQEIDRKLPIMLSASAHFPEYTRVVACTPNLDISYYSKFKDENVIFLENKTYALLQQSELALVTSGTATLETALFEVPQIVCYKSSSVSYWIAKCLVKIKFISLVNLIMNKEIVSELIQDDCNEEFLVAEIKKIKVGGSKRLKIKSAYQELIAILGKEGASERIALDILKNI